MIQTKTRTKCVKFLVCSIACLLCLSLVPPQADAALLRGRLVRALPNGQIVPVTGISVTVFRADIGRSSPSVTDGNGMYYLNVPPGSYVLEVWVTNPPRAYQIQIAEPGTDIPPIYI